jgi:heme-degrading monooxygenase HmoA
VSVVHIVWEFQVKPDKIEEFERNYASYGTWAELFRRSPKYGGTVLTQDQADGTRYLLTDLWESTDAFAEFKRVHDAEYQALDKRCEELTIRETKLGTFEKVEQRQVE